MVGGARRWLGPEGVARGGAFFPVLGLLLGGLAVGVVSAVVSLVGADHTALVAVSVLAGLTSAALPRGMAGAAALALLSLIPS